MKFKIHHISRIFYRGELVSVILYFLVLVVCRSIGITFQEKVLVLYTMLEIVIMFLFNLLLVFEKIFGATVYIESECIKVNMLFRQKKIYFDDIADMHYSSYITSNRFSPDESEGKTFGMFSRSKRRHTRFQLVFSLYSGKTFRLNDALISWRKMQEYQNKKYYSHTDFRINPDEDVELYRLYQCCKANINENRK